MGVEFKQVCKSFGPKAVLKNVSFSVTDGEILFILGKSGMGKSVTLKHIVGMLRPDSGQILVDGEDVTRMDEIALTRVRRKCGMVFQHPALLDSLTVLGNVSFGLRTLQYVTALLSCGKKALSENQIEQTVLEKLALVNLGPEILDLFPPEISYGMQKRVSLARTLAPEPQYLLFDEPTTGLDPITTNAVNDLISNLSRKLNVTSVVVSHDMACALKIADRILVLDQGEVLALGTVPEILCSAQALVKEFLFETIQNGEPNG